MKVYRIVKYRTGGQKGRNAPLVMDSLVELEELIGGMEEHDIGDSFGIRVIDMPWDEFDKLQEWGGW